MNSSPSAEKRKEKKKAEINRKTVQPLKIEYVLHYQRFSGIRYRQE
jgi:hypothetical protein